MLHNIVYKQVNIQLQHADKDAAANPESPIKGL
jgi:hypothetical protein